MLDSFFFVGLPYAAIFTFVVGSIYRFKSNKFSYSALSSQFLEDKKLLWGTLPWHIGIFVVLLGHFLAFIMPSAWMGLTANKVFLFTVESIGIACTILALVGLSALIYRRMTDSRLQKITSTLDLAILGLLLCQVLSGFWIALQYRWGASWAPGTTTPYLWSLIRLTPELGYIAELPGLVKVHIANAWIILLVFPFSRLVHVFSLPLQYLIRSPQRVVWSSERRFHHINIIERDERRHFLRGSIGVAAAGTLLSVGFLDKMVHFFRGPNLTEEEKAELIETRLKRLKMTAEERELELVRLRSEYIEVAKLADLDSKKGKYFIDYQMRPALAFKDNSGLPNLISAKCTHLGCTVGSETDSQGRVLCPCHVSYFDIKTGMPNSGAPATVALPHLGWVLMSPTGEMLASKGPGGELHGKPTTEQLATARVYIAKKYEEKA